VSVSLGRGFVDVLSMSGGNDDLFNLFGVQSVPRSSTPTESSQIHVAFQQEEDPNPVSVEILYWSRQHEEEMRAKLRSKVKSLELVKKLEMRLLDSGNDTLHLIVRQVDRSMMNAIRRIMTEWVPTLTIDTMEPANNQWEGVLHEDFIAHRLGLIPLISESLERMKPIDHFHKIEECDCAIGCELCTVTFELDIDIPQSTEESPQSDTYVYSGDLLPDVYNPDIRPASNSILITKLSPGTGIHLKAYANKNVGNVHAKWSPVVAPAAYATPRVELNDEIIFKMSEREREKFVKSCPSNVFSPNPQDNRVLDVEDALKCTTCGSCVRWCRMNKKPPDTVKIEYNLDREYVLRIESDGSYPSFRILQLTLKILREKLNQFLIHLAESIRDTFDLDSEKHITITSKEAPQDYYRYSLLAKKEDHTLGYLLSRYGKKHAQVSYFEYREDHPLLNEIRFELIFEQSVQASSHYITSTLVHNNHPVYILLEEIVRHIYTDIDHIDQRVTELLASL